MFKLFIFIAAFWAIFVNAHALTNDPQRELKQDEIVIHHFSIAQVIEKSNEHTYLIRNLNHFNSVITVERDELSVMDGCFEKICVKDIFFDVGYLRYVSIEGITFGGDYIVESSEGWNGYYQPFKNNLARTSGCHPSVHRKLCVGDMVKDFNGNLMTIIGIHADSKLVLKSNDGWNTYRTFVDESSLSLI